MSEQWKLEELSKKRREELANNVQENFHGRYIDRPPEGDDSRYRRPKKNILKPLLKNAHKLTSQISNVSLPGFSLPKIPALPPINKKYALGTVAAAAVLVAGYAFKDELVDFSTGKYAGAEQSIALRTAEQPVAPSVNPIQKLPAPTIALEPLPTPVLANQPVVQPLEEIRQTPEQTTLEMVLDSLNPVSSVRADPQLVALEKAPQKVYFADNNFNPQDIPALRAQGYEKLMLTYSLQHGGLDAHFSSMGFSPMQKDAIMKETTVRNGFVDVNGDGYGDRGIIAGKEYIAEYVIPAPKVVAPRPVLPEKVVSDGPVLKFEGLVEEGQTPLQYFRDLGLSVACSKDAIKATGLENGFTAEFDVNNDGLFDYWQAGKSYTMAVTQNCGDSLGNFDIQYKIY